jgi:hypothetical protein
MNGYVLMIAQASTTWCTSVFRGCLASPCNAAQIF